jgi:hypothetical protein
MPFRRVLLLRIVRWLLLLGGLWALLASALAAFGGYGHLWLFTKSEPHRFTAMAMLTGTLRLRNGLARAGFDEQTYNGATYTNWGFGVPLLQTPFQAVAHGMASFPSRFFPDRAIYFFYLAALIPFLWAAFDRLLAMRAIGVRGERLRRHALSWSATLFALTCALYPLMSCRFLMYEETISYLVVFELAAVAAYIFALSSWSSAAVAGMGVASGIGLLVRPTGLVLVGVLGLLVALESRRRKPMCVFAAAVAPFLCAWLYTNAVRSGSPFSLGYSNGMPWFEYHTGMLRFGSRCVDTPEHGLQAAARLFRAFFVALPDDASDPLSWMKRCHFDFETRPPATESYALEPFFGVVVLAVLAWILLRHLVRRERRLAVYVPFGAMAALFAAYVLGGAGFGWRYEGDFWPLIVLVCVDYVRVLPLAANQFLGLRLALVLGIGSAAQYERIVAPAQVTLETLPPGAVATLWETFRSSRWSVDAPVPSHLECGSPLAPLHNNGKGWDAGCGVNTFTNVFLGVPPKKDDTYTVRFRVEGEDSPTLRVYVNGRLYTATKNGATYAADVHIRYGALTTPTVVATIEWTRALEPPRLKLRSIELT